MTTLPEGFTASGVTAGLKPSGARDLGLLVSDRAAVCAGTFTTNRVKAAPVVLTRRHVRRGSARAIVVNAGNANACTGEQGTADARAMAKASGVALGGLSEREILVASTGIIGVPMPMALVREGIVEAAAARTRGGLDDLAAAIMTTDTRPKIASEVLPGGARIVGIAKGAGMIAPEMATMLAFLATDAPVPHGILAPALHASIGGSFNAISVDGCMSTNDCVLMLANGAAGGDDLTAETASAFTEALGSVTQSLARQIVEDGEGATKVVSILVEGARSETEARRAASVIADSVLVRCAIGGGDPNWGRIMAALGTAPIPFDPAVVDVFLAGEMLCERGGPGPGNPEAAAKRMQQREVEIRVDLHRGGAHTTILTNDLTAEYVRINTEYTT